MTFQLASWFTELLLLHSCIQIRTAFLLKETTTRMIVSALPQQRKRGQRPSLVGETRFERIIIDTVQDLYIHDGHESMDR